MEIKIGQFKVVSDSSQFTIYEEKITGEKAKNSGEIIDRVVGYYPTFESCLKAIPTKALLRSNAQSLSEALEVVKNYHDMIKLLSINA